MFFFSGKWEKTLRFSALFLKINRCVRNNNDVARNEEFAVLKSENRQIQIQIIPL